MKHTKGPWYLDKFGDLKSGSSKSTRNMVPFYGVLSGSEEAKANSILIAAAPDLLEALKNLCDWFDGETRESAHSRIDAACAAIAKAEGL